MTNSKMAAGQLELFDLPPVSSPPPTPLDQELAAFRCQLQQTGLRASTADVSSRHLRSMLKTANVATLTAMVEDPALVVKMIASTPRRKNRLSRHNAVTQFLECFEEQLNDRASRCRDYILDALPGRPNPIDHLADVEVAGSTKLARTRVPFTMRDGELLIEHARTSGSRITRVRETALVALHVRSGLPSWRLRLLDWNDVVDSIGESGELVTLRLDTRGHRFPYVVHAVAVIALREWWRFVGRPRAGPVFATLKRPRGRLSEGQFRDVVGQLISGAGFKGLDRRNLRVPFAHFLLGRGWHEIAVADAFAYPRLRDLRLAVRLQEEYAAQAARVEFLVLPSAVDRSPEHHELDSQRRSHDAVESM